MGAADRATWSCVLVAGAWLPESVWAQTVTGLARRGVAARSVSVPGRDSISGGNLADQVAAVVSAAERWSADVLVGHSHGGSIVTGAAAQLGDAVGIVYVDASVPARGQSTADTWSPGLRAEMLAARRGPVVAAPADVADRVAARHGLAVQDEPWEPLVTPLTVMTHGSCRRGFVRTSTARSSYERTRRVFERAGHPTAVVAGGQHLAMLNRPDDLADAIADVGQRLLENGRR